uniref:Cytochrome c oxidase polypeptide II n=1 Tax=Stylonychia lemnae TaxID=5949 RepID=A0A3Q8BMS8_STYLE|nr:Cox2 [Stylonychia lemnae]
MNLTFLKLNTIDVVNFIDQTNEILTAVNLENLDTVYHYSVPNVKLYYPEPFIASASFMHSDIWFLHILIYQYWLWFVFIFIIVFFFITFLCTVRWCNMRVKPRRETRGVSRSKCGDLITACVPVSWATSIIVSESTDAIDYFDGYGTTELVVGIRAYQWGWEYYYPKDLDLHYNLKKNYSSFVGNSLKYEKSTDSKSSSIDLWKLYQSKSSDSVVTPAHLLVVPFENAKLFNLFNFNDIGLNSLQESNAFKKIKIFSKIFSSDLHFQDSKFLNKFNKINSYLASDDSYINSSSLASKRQHNFLSSKTFINKPLTHLDVSSIKKLINFNFKTNIIKSKNRNNFIFNFNTNSSSTSYNENNFFNLMNKKLFTSSFLNLSKFKTYESLLNYVNNNSDKKQLANAYSTIFNKKINKYNFFNKQQLIENKLNFENLIFSKSNENFSEFSNKSINVKKFDFSSSNQSILLPNRNIKNFVNNKPNKSALNHISNLNSINFLKQNLKATTNSSQVDILKNYLSKNVNIKDFKKLSNSKITVESPLSPIPSSNLTIASKNYDNLKFTYADNTPLVLQGKEEVTSTSLTSMYWNFFWSNTDLDWRLLNSAELKRKANSFYLPIFVLYYDYDFRNWQSMEMLEDSYWETTYSSYSFDESSSLADIYKAVTLDEDSSSSFNINKILLKYDTSLNNLSLYSDDFFTDVSSLNTKNFNIFGTYSLFTQAEENFESYKSLNHFFDKIGFFVFLKNNSNLLNTTYSTVLDSFRSDYDEFSWIFDEKINQTDFFTNLLEEDVLNHDLENNFEKDSSFFNSDNRASNSINLRATARNAIVTYNAIQKVFRTRLDENRSNAKMSDFNNSSAKQPFVSASRTTFENLLGKNKNNFFNIVSFKENSKKYFNSFYFADSSLNFQFFDFPFLLALKSDSSRYLWLDWFAKWGFFEVQPSSSSRYAIYGMPYFNKVFEYSSHSNENLNETETYLLRIGRSRKNFLPNWVYTPYFYAKNREWRKNNIFFENKLNFKDSMVSTKILLLNSNWYWTKLSLINSTSKTFFPSHSGLTTYNRSNWKPLSGTQYHYWATSSLIDILTKREFLYRELFLNNKKIISLPKTLTANPSHPLLLEIKNSFNFFDKIYLNSEYSREAYLYSLDFFNYTYFKLVYASLSSSINFNKNFDSFLFYFFDSSLTKEKKFNDLSSFLHKNQYRPLKKGITNMVRLHATGAIAMPIEIRIQVLASSKDVIHSWAIPSAGIKIDCVPGYSSHRVMIFLVSGIFWGQCMEICGRYHHWMPIIVYFMKRDLFFLWCTHFIFFNPYSNSINSNDRQLLDFIKPVSFSKSSWSLEL